MPQDLQIEPQLQSVVDKAKQFSPHGVIKITSTGFLYLDVQDAFVTELYPLLKKKVKKVKMPDYFSEGDIGAHVTIAVEDETKGLIIEELGKVVRFEVLHVASAIPEKHRHVIERVWFLVVNAPELESLRTKYLLTPKVNAAHEFHITIGVKFVM